MRKILVVAVVLAFLLFGCLEPTITDKDVYTCKKGNYAPKQDNFASGAKVSLVEISGWRAVPDDPYGAQDCLVKFTFQEPQTVLGTRIQGQICTFGISDKNENLAQEFESGQVDMSSLINADSCEPW